MPALRVQILQVLQTDNDNAENNVNLLARLAINELYFALDDIADAAIAKDGQAAKFAWRRGKEYLNSYLRIVNFQINAKVGDKFALVEATV